MRGQGRGGAQSTPSSGSITLSGDVTGTAAATVVSAISGASPIVITPSVLQWTAATATPTLTQAALASTSAGSGAAGQGMSVTAQAGQAATGAGHNGGLGGSLTFAPGQGGTSGSATPGNPGDIILALPATTATTESSVKLTRGGTRFMTLMTDPGTSGADAAIYFGSATPTSGNYSFLQDGAGNVYLNGASGQGIYLTSNAAVDAYITAASVALNAPLAGYSTTPLAFKGQTSPNTVALGAGGTQTISAAQAIIPFFLVTATNPLTSNAIIDFSTNASTGTFFVDMTGALAIGAGGFTIGFKNGTKTQTFSLSQLTAFAATGLTSMTVKTYGTNLITVGA